MIFICLTISIASLYGQDSTGTVTDFDGNIYKTVKIGDQWWMAENLNVTHYRNGDPIPHCRNYDNELANGKIYGKLYNWYAVDDSCGLAPEGWHVPSKEEWRILLFDYLDGSSAGGQMKEAGTAHWKKPNVGATNESGFTALPGGCYYYDGSFRDMGSKAYFWSSTEAEWYSAESISLLYSQETNSGGTSGKQFGASVRCVKDN